MIFGRRGRERFVEAVAGLEAAVRERDGDRSQRGFRELHRHFDGARDHEISQAGPRLAAPLPEVPPGPRALERVLDVP